MDILWTGRIYPAFLFVLATRIKIPAKPVEPKPMDLVINPLIQPIKKGKIT
jgi:hypothetical protein